jgi:ribosome-binding factor A
VSKRIKKVNQLIKKELSQIILREIEFLPGSLVTLTRIETSPNLIESKVYFSVIPSEKQKNAFSVLNRQIWHIQQLLNKRLRMRPIPKIIFLEEKQIVEAAKVEEILEDLQKLKKKRK